MNATLVRATLFLLTLLFTACSGSGPFAEDVHRAALAGNMTRIKAYVEAGGNVDTVGDGGSLLRYAALGGHVELLRYLIAKGADEKKRSFGKALIHDATESKNVVAVQFFLDRGVDVNCPTTGDSILEFVDSLGHLCRMHRHELSERKWLAIEPYTRGHLSRGRANRLFVNAVIYRVCTGIAWRDLPEGFGPWNTVARRFRRWALAGAWERLFQAVQTPDYAWVLVDSTTVKAHKAAAGQKKAPPRPRPSAVVAAGLAASSTPSSTP